MTTKTPTRSGVNGKTFATAPASPPLATPSFLSGKQVQAVSEAINPLIADSFALYIKTKNFHWHLSGVHFRDLHLLFDEHAAVILASIDPLAERLRKIGGTTIRSVSHVCNIQTISDNNDDFVSAYNMVRELMEDNKHMAEQQQKAIQVCEDNEDLPTSNILEEILDETQRRTWFLFEILQSMDQKD